MLQFPQLLTFWDLCKNNRNIYFIDGGNEKHLETGAFIMQKYSALE